MPIIAKEDPMRRQLVKRERQRGRARRKGQGDDTAPVGSITGQPAQVQVSCQVFVCVRVGFRWAAPAAADITGIVPAPTARERRKIINGLFGPVPLAPLQLPAELDAQPCIFGCSCVGIRWGAWTPNQIPQTVTKDVDLLQAGQPPKTFTVTLAIPANVRQGIGNCQ
jgi:hypothetical protein